MAISILYVNGGPMNRGGIETFMMNYLRHMDLNQIHIDFAVRGPERGTYDDESVAKSIDFRREVNTQLPFKKN